eukprot:scaffold187200_cov33-Tisochrysis_lutea.AAC.3
MNRHQAVRAGRLTAHAVQRRSRLRHSAPSLSHDALTTNKVAGAERCELLDAFGDVYDIHDADEDRQRAHSVKGQTCIAEAPHDVHAGEAAEDAYIGLRDCDAAPKQLDREEHDHAHDHAPGAQTRERPLIPLSRDGRWLDEARDGARPASKRIERDAELAHCYLARCYALDRGVRQHVRHVSDGGEERRSAQHEERDRFTEHRRVDG